jgi:probable addiction module antidote protein
MRDKSHDEAVIEIFRENPSYAIELLNTVLQEGEQGELLVILRQMAKAFGGVQKIAERSQLNATQLYRTLSPDGNPALTSLSAILKAMGLRLAIQFEDRQGSRAAQMKQFNTEWQRRADATPKKQVSGAKPSRRTAPRSRSRRKLSA